MSTQSSPFPRPLPERPNLRHLKDQARDLYKSGGAESLTQAQFRVAREYGFASWARLKAHVESLDRTGQLKTAIQGNNVERVTELITAYPTLIHQDGGAPLVRALAPDRLPMLKVLIGFGANVNAEVWGWFPMIFFPCENLEPDVLKVLLDNGANPNCAPSDRRGPGTALDYAISTYVRRQHDLTACIDLLLAARATTRFDVPVVMDLLRGRVDSVAERLTADPSLVTARFPRLEFGATGGRMLMLQGATLLHVAAEFQNLEAATLLLDRGADVNARATVSENGVGGQTPLFHSATQFSDNGLPLTRLLVERGADLTVRTKVPGHYERGGEIVECTALGYALHLEEVTRKPKTIAFLRKHGAPE